MFRSEIFKDRTGVTIKLFNYFSFRSWINVSNCSKKTPGYIVLQGQSYFDSFSVAVVIFKTD